MLVLCLEALVCVTMIVLNFSHNSRCEINIILPPPHTHTQTTTTTTTTTTTLRPQNLLKKISHTLSHQIEERERERSGRERESDDAYEE